MSFTLFSNRKAQINNAITSIQDQIAQLQQQLADQQAFLQELGTVEQAGESAINQARTFLTMVHAIDPSQEEVFWQAMDALKNEAMAVITASPEDKGSPGTPEPSDEPEGGDAIEVEAVEVEESTSAEDMEAAVETAEEDVVDKPTLNGNGKVYLDEAALNNLTMQSIRKLASIKGVESKGKRWEIASRLTGMVTQQDVEALS